MASYLDRLRNEVLEASLVGFTIGAVLISDLRSALVHIGQVELDNDELRRENERLLKALAPTVRPAAAPEPDMCCGGTCVRAVCFIHGVGNG